VVEDHYNIIGLVIYASFLVFGGISVIVYRPWQRYIDCRERELDEQGTEEGMERDALLWGDKSGEGYDEGLEEDTSLHRQGGDGFQPV
jgi:hypothetical protein